MTKWNHLCVAWAENASDVAEQLKAFTNNKLNEKEVSVYTGICSLKPPVTRRVTPCPPVLRVQVSKVVSKVEQLVNVAKINFTLASSIVTIISNVMSGSATVPATSDKYRLLTLLTSHWWHIHWQQLLFSYYRVAHLYGYTVTPFFQ